MSGGGWRWLLLLLLCGPLLSCGPLQFYSGYGRVTSAEIYAVERQRDWPRRPDLTLELSQIKRLGFERVAIAHAGELVFEWQRDPSSDELPPRVHSLTKSLLSALVGIAVQEGKARARSTRAGRGCAGRAAGAKGTKQRPEGRPRAALPRPASPRS